MRHPVIAPLVVFALLLSPAVAKDEKKKMADQFTGTLVSMNAPGAMGSRVQIWIEEYTNDATAEGLIKTLSEQGQRALLDKVTDLRVGTIKVGTSNGYPISVARQRVAPEMASLIVNSIRRFAGLHGGVAPVAT